ncbi:MAG: flagellar protein FliS, partial [Polyangiaceae bacterium]|nr:flagellar protein FliS [Polyangiaceae bacterium]
ALAAARRYRQTQVHTSTRAGIIVLLYDGLVRFLAEGEAALAHGDAGLASAPLGRAHAILAELASTLRLEVAPQLSGELLRLYDFGMHHLMLGLRSRSPERVAEVARVFAPLRDAWRQAAAAVDGQRSETRG